MLVKCQRKSAVNIRPASLLPACPFVLGRLRKQIIAHSNLHIFAAKARERAANKKKPPWYKQNKRLTLDDFGLQIPSADKYTTCRRCVRARAPAGKRRAARVSLGSNSFAAPPVNHRAGKASAKLSLCHRYAEIPQTNLSTVKNAQTNKKIGA